MRKHGWQLPYHPLQVVAVSVFLALGFAFYVFFAPFLGKQLLQYIVMGIYTPLIMCVFGLYVWCVAADPADPGVSTSRKNHKVSDKKKHTKLTAPKLAGESVSSEQHPNLTGVKAKDKSKSGFMSVAENDPAPGDSNTPFHHKPGFMALLALLPCAYVCSSNEESSIQQMSDDGMFYCSLCKVEVFKYSKHCRVCDKCVDHFDHHCRWLNNCVGKRNYRKFFTLMVAALMLFILQWSTGILVLIFCFLERKKYSVDISSKLGSSFTMLPFVIVVAVCTLLAMLATLPLAQLFFFHILLIKKGLSTYDYIIALREQEQQVVGSQQSQQMSPASSVTGLSSASSFNNIHRAAWCTPPRLFLEDQFDVVPPDTGSVSSVGKKMGAEEPVKKKDPTTVKISPWALARLNAEDISKAAMAARKKSKILRPVARQNPSYGVETDSSFGRQDDNRKKTSKRIRLPAEIPKISETSTSLAPPRFEVDSSYRTGIPNSSPDSSLGSPDIRPVRALSPGDEEARRIAMANLSEMPLSRSTSGGYDASGGEDSDQIPARIQHRSSNWDSLVFSSEQERVKRYKPPPPSWTTKR